MRLIKVSLMVLMVLIASMFMVSVVGLQLGLISEENALIDITRAIGNGNLHSLKIAIMNLFS